jgi:hemolysin activation/secretion protein
MSRGFTMRQLILSLLLVLSVLAHAAPDAGSVLQQLEPRPVAPSLKAPNLQTPQAPTPSAEGGGGPVLHVRAFRIDGATLLSSEVLQKALAGFVERDLSLTQLQEAAWVVTQTYREAGWLVNAFVPQQEVEQGQVRIQVVEARLGQIHVDIQPDVRIGEQQIRDLVLAQIQSGQPLSLARVDHALMLIDELAGVLSSGSFAPSQTEGATDLVILVGGGKTVDTQLSVDNHGARTTGENRRSASFNVNSLMGIGDQLNIHLIDTVGSSYRRAAYSLPIGRQGLRVGLHASEMNYNFVWSFMPISGLARSSGLDLSGPWLRSTTSRWSWSLVTDNKQLQNSSNDAVTSDYRIDVARAALNGSWQDNSFSLAQNSLVVTVSSGKVNNPADTTGVHGSFNKLNLAYNREQDITGRLSWIAQAQTQHATRNLDSSEKLFLGGVYGVRAYPANEVGGASGYLATLGLRQRLDQGFTLSGFVDWGRVNVCHNMLDVCLKSASSSASGQEPTTQALQGYGLSLAWQTEAGLDFNATWSRRLGHHPNPDANGLDSDQTRVINRVWLSATLRF